MTTPPTAMPMKMMNDSSKIARAMGCSRWWIASLKRAARESVHPETGKPDNCFRGRYSSVEWILAWLERHPEFVANRVYPRAVQPQQHQRSKGAVAA